MARGSGFSAQALAVLAVLADQPGRWQHGYAIARDTGLKSGSLYPILIRLAERGLLEACWEQEQPAGRPRRHLYRLTPGGLGMATTALAADGHGAAAAQRAAGRESGRLSGRAVTS